MGSSEIGLLTSGQRLRVSNISVLLLRQITPGLTLIQGDKLTVPARGLKLTFRMVREDIIETLAKQSLKETALPISS